MQHEESLLEGLSVDHESPVPAYYQLEEAIRARLVSGGLQPGMRLPVEREIARHLSVSRMTVRHALGRLEREGLLVRRRGDGTYVAEPKVETDLRFLSGFSSEVEAMGHRVRSRVLDFGLTRPDPAVRKLLAVPAGPETVIRLRRIRDLDGVPSTLETSWLPAWMCQPILGSDLTDRSLYQVLAETVGVRPAHAEERLTATVLDEFEAGHLRRPQGSAAFLIEQLSFDHDDRPMEYVKNLLRADRFVFKTTLDLVPSGTSVRRGASS